MRSRLHASSRSRAGFTLTELLVAIAVLVIVIVGTSKIFGTASKVTGMAQANQDVLQEAAAIERQIREDIARLSKEGFFAIHCVSVRNDVKGPGQPLLNPNLPPDALIRADQLVFFATGVEGTQSYRLAAGSNHKAQGTVSRIYYGPTFQLPRGLAVNAVTPSSAGAHDPDLQATGAMTPWWNGSCTMVRTNVQTGAGNGNFSRTPAGAIDGKQPEVRRMLLARQCIALLDDDTQANNDNSKTVFLGNTLTARSIFVDAPAAYGFTREILNGRADASSMLANEIRRWVTFSGINPRPWLDPAFPIGAGGDQKTVIRSAVYYPRAERSAPSTHRIDQSLTNNVIASACSSFTIDWTYEGSDVQRVDGRGNIVGGVGEILDTLGNVIDPDGTVQNGDEWTGMIVRSDGEQPWFGLSDPIRGVRTYAGAVVPANGWQHATTIPFTFPNNIESESPANTQFNNAANTVNDYWAVFGYNQTRPFDALGALDESYTPWPTAIRISMVLHDPNGTLESGREVQFVIDLPRKER